MILTTFLKENNAKLKLTKKLLVRDLDEIEKNKFVAYVDEKDDSYDVQIILDSKKSIIETSCDCPENSTCLHILALADFITNNHVEKQLVKKIVKKKSTETDEILNELDNETLRNWLSETLNKNKELAFTFKNQFSIKHIVFDENFIKTTIQACIQSVVGKRKKLETNEVKKIADALTISLKTLLENISNAPIDDKKYKLAEILIDELEKINYDYYISSIKITRLIEGVFDSLLKTLFTLKDFEVWKHSIEFYFSNIFKDKYRIKELQFCTKIYNFSKENPLQKSAIATIVEQHVTEIYGISGLDYFSFNLELESFILNLFIENDLFKKHFNKFRPRRFQNDHNLKLIAALLEIDKISLAEKFCLIQIEGNVKAEYDLPYINLLIEIYKLQNEKPKLATLLSNYGKYLFDIENYHFIKENASAENFKKYRVSVMCNARNSYQRGNIGAFDFYFEIKKLDGKTADLFEMLSNSYNLGFIDHYKEIAAQLNEAKFIETMCRFSSFYSAKEENFTNIVNFTIKNIDQIRLKFYLSHVNIYSRNKFYFAVEHALT
jgi:hypothetical protein